MICTWFIIGFMRLIKLDNQPFTNLIKLLINLVSMHYLSRFSGNLAVRAISIFPSFLLSLSVPSSKRMPSAARRGLRLLGGVPNPLNLLLEFKIS
jgi:hypothetical protein